MLVDEQVRKKHCWSFPFLVLKRWGLGISSEKPTLKKWQPPSVLYCPPSILAVKQKEGQRMKKTGQLNCLRKNPDWCDSVGWALSHRAKCPRFDSWSGYMPGLWLQSPVRVHTEDDQCMCISQSNGSLPIFLTHFPSLYISINNILKKIQKGDSLLPHEDSKTIFP